MRIFTILLAIFALGLFVHVDQPFGISLLRLGLSDVLLPVLLGYAVIFLRQPVRPLLLNSNWLLQGLPIWLGGLTLLLAAALLHGWIELGYVSRWALLNKFCGWIILLAYLCLGAIVARLPLHRPAALPFKLVLAGFLVTGLPPLVTAVPGPEGAYMFGRFWEGGRLIGLLQNPNAYGLCAVVAIGILIPYVKQARTGWKIATVLVAFLACYAALFLTGSRSAIFAGVLLLVLMPVPDGISLPRLSVTLASVAVVFAGLWFTFPIAQRATMFLALQGNEKPQATTHQQARLNFAYNTEQHRAFVFGSALEQFRASPIIGIGLGVYLERDRKSYEARLARTDGQQEFNPVGIHNTGLWLLTEAGVIGFGAFAAFFMLVAWRLLGSARGQGHAGTAQQMLFVLVGCGAASLGMDVLYLRPLWFLLGASLILPPPEPRDLTMATNSGTDRV